jgi:proteasome accessory factor C
MTNPQYVARFVRVTRAIEALTYHPGGMSLADLASQLDTDASKLRQEIRAFYAADVTADLVGGYYEPVIEFLGHPDLPADEADPATAGYVRLSHLGSPALGTKFMSVTQLANLSRAGHERAMLEPDNTALKDALSVLDDGILGGVDAEDTSWRVQTARQLRQAAEERRRVRITYARAWRAGVVERVILPYRLTHTRRGWEVDAGVPSLDDVRTYLVSGIQELAVLDEVFDLPPDVEARMAANRRPYPVIVVVPHSARWAVEAYAEAVDVLADDEEELKLRADVLPPAEIRVGLMLISAGPDAFVVEPASMQDAAQNLAADLLAHHRPRP